MRRALARSLRAGACLVPASLFAAFPAAAQDGPTRVAASLTTPDAEKAREELSALLRAMEHAKPPAVPTFRDVVWPEQGLSGAIRTNDLSAALGRDRSDRSSAQTIGRPVVVEGAASARPSDVPTPPIEASHQTAPALPRPRPSYQPGPVLAAVPTPLGAIVVPPPNPRRTSEHEPDVPVAYGPPVPPPPAPRTLVGGTDDDAADEPTVTNASALTSVAPPPQPAGAASRIVRAAGAVLATPAQAAPGENADVAPVETYDGPRPHYFVRLLTTLQDDMARGSGAALQAQNILLDRMEALFPTIPGAVWSEPVEGRSLVIYALSGGRPEVVRAIREKGTLLPEYDTLARGALAYLEGRSTDALATFAGLDVDNVDVSVRGQLALSLAALHLAEDPELAQELLSKARFAAPGTLVEEAALRRATIIAADRDDVDAFERLTNRYLRKFRSSIYAGNFRARIASAITRMSFMREASAFDRLTDMLAPMSPAGQRELYLLLARAALENGDENAARVAASRSLETAQPDTLDHRRASLYLGAADVVSPERFGTAIETLRNLEPDALPAADRALLNAALRLSQNVADLPAPTPSAERFATVNGLETELAVMEPPAHISERMNEIFAAVDPLLRDTD